MKGLLAYDSRWIAALQQAMRRAGLSGFARFKACRPGAESLLSENRNSDQRSRRENLPRRRDAKVQGEIITEGP